MYDPDEANKTYINLLKEKGMIASIKSALLVMTIYFFNKLISQQETSGLSIVFVYFFFCIYFSFKSKFVRFLRGHLRGEEFRNKSRENIQKMLQYVNEKGKCEVHILDEDTRYRTSIPDNSVDLILTSPLWR